MNDCCRRLRVLILIVWTANKKSLISQPSLSLFTLYHPPLPPLPPLAVMRTRLALLQPKPHPLARVCSGSTTKGILTAVVESQVRSIRRSGGLQV